MEQRLWIVTELFPPDETSTAYILGEIANAMAQKYHVGVICGPEIYDKRKKIDKNNIFQLDPTIKVLRVKSINADKNSLLGKTLMFLFMSIKLLHLAKKNIKSGDKVLMVTNPAPLVVLMSKFKKKRRFELNILVHDVFPENTKPAGLNLPGLIYKFIKKVFDKAYSKADLLIALGRDMKDVLTNKIRKYNPNIRIEIVENWGDVIGITPQSFPTGRIILEYAGNIGRVQGLDRVIDELPGEIDFHLYGTGAMEEELKQKKKSNVFFKGAYFRSQQTEVLGACNIALVTLEDGMYGLGVPSKTYNILSAGRPILYLGPENSEIDLLVRENRVGYCSWPQKWDRDELEEMGRRARKLAEEKYSTKVILNKFLKII